MGSALEWIGQIAEWIGKFIPRWFILDMTEGAIKCEGFFLPPALRKFKGGMRITVCSAGLHWYWPATTQCQTYPTARQADNLPCQTFVTQDNVTITVSGMIVYCVEDIAQLMTTTFSAAKAVQDITLTAIHDVCCNLEWAALKSEQRKGTLDTKLKNAAQRGLRDYGVRVIKCMLTDLAPSRVYRLINSTSVDE